MMTLCLPFFLKKKNTLDFEVLHLVKPYVIARFLPPVCPNWSNFLMKCCIAWWLLYWRVEKSIEMLIFLKEVCCLYSANSWRMSVFSLYCHPFKSEAWKVWFWFLNSLPHHLGQIACNNVRICGKRILVTTCFLQHLFF